MRKLALLFFISLLVSFAVYPTLCNKQAIQESFDRKSANNFSLILATSNTTIPQLMTPENNSFIQAAYPITFEWTNVSGAINFTLQIDKSLHFNTAQLIEKKGINSTTYTLNEGLSDGTWYWRVYAVLYNNTKVYSEIWCINVASRETPELNPLQDLLKWGEIAFALILFVLMIILFPGGIIAKKYSSQKE
ncbi:MAG: hypothetical protein J7L47_06845 [Candidatus Odinarchaeota archaeon]|nr:hypothetical protein [Candidatus Odinarchaeota archaeon]